MMNDRKNVWVTQPRLCSASSSVVPPNVLGPHTGSDHEEKQMATSNPHSSADCDDGIGSA